MHVTSLFIPPTQSTRPTGIIPLVQCSRVSNAKEKFGDQLSYCIGLELNDAKYYLKAESARSYNEWIGVREYWKLCGNTHAERRIVFSVIEIVYIAM